MEPVIAIQIILNPDNQVGINVTGPGANSKALIAGLLEIGKNMILNPQKEVSPILMARGGFLPDNGNER